MSLACTTVNSCPLFLNYRTTGCALGPPVSWAYIVQLQTLTAGEMPFHLKVYVREALAREFHGWPGR